MGGEERSRIGLKLLSARNRGEKSLVGAQHGRAHTSHFDFPETKRFCRFAVVGERRAHNSLTSSLRFFGTYSRLSNQTNQMPRVCVCAGTHSHTVLPDESDVTYDTHCVSIQQQIRARVLTRSKYIRLFCKPFFFPNQESGRFSRRGILMRKFLNAFDDESKTAEPSTENH